MNRVRLLLGLPLVALLALLTACGPAPTPEVIKEMVEVEVTRVVEKEGETVIETVVEEVEVVVTATPAAVEEPVTLTVWDQFGGEKATIAVDLIYANFMRKYPNITIEREIVSTSQMDQTGRTALASGTGPDIIYADVSPAREYIDADLIMPLDDYAKQYGWYDHFTDTGLSWTLYKGKLWGLGAESEFVGIWVNNTLFEQEGLEVPQTLDELLAFCPVAKEKGYVPFAHFGGRPGPYFGSFTNPIHNYVGVDYIEGMLFEGEGRWDDPEIIAAVKTVFEDMKEAGCFIDDFNAMGHGGAVDLFYSQETFLLPVGTWMTQGMIDFSEQEDVEVSMMPWFGYETGQARVWTMGMGSAYFVSVNSNYPNEAALFLDYIFSEEAVKIWVEYASYIPPVKIDTSKLALEPLQAFVIDELSKGGMGYDVDVLAQSETPWGRQPRICITARFGRSTARSRISWRTTTCRTRPGCPEPSPTTPRCGTTCAWRSCARAAVSRPTTRLKFG